MFTFRYVFLFFSGPRSPEVSLAEDGEKAHGGSRRWPRYPVCSRFGLSTKLGKLEELIYRAGAQILDFHMGQHLAEKKELLFLKKLI